MGMNKGSSSGELMVMDDYFISGAKPAGPIAETKFDPVSRALLFKEKRNAC